MLKSVLAASFVAAALSAVPASALITIYTGPDALQPDENVLFNNVPAPVGFNAFGRTNQTNTLVTFTGIEALATPAQGQARITGADGNLSQLDFALDPGFGFTEVEFNIFGGGNSSTATLATLTFTDQFGGQFAANYNLDNNSNWFSAASFDNQIITNVSILLNGIVPDVRQVRIGGIAEIDGLNPGGVIPEPASWAMMMTGFGLVGGAMRRRQRQTVVAA